MKPNSNILRILEVHVQAAPPRRESNGRGTRILPISHSAPHSNLSTKSNAPDGNDQTPCCRVTHCFHPLYDKVIQIVSTKKTWGEDRVFYHQEDGRLTSIPACWTSVYDSEVFNVISDGRSDFRFKELLQLARLVDSILSEGQ